MAFVFEDELPTQPTGQFIFEDELPAAAPPPTAREAEIIAHEKAGGGILSGLERGARRSAQTLTPLTSLDTDGGSPIASFLIQQGLMIPEALGMVPLLSEAKIRQQQSELEQLPQHPSITRMGQAATTAAEEAPGLWEAIKSAEPQQIGEAVTGLGRAIGAAGKEFYESPDKLGLATETLAEQVPVLATFAAGTKGAGSLMGGTQTLAKQAAALGAGGALSSVASTYGPNVAEGLGKGLSYDDAEARALKQSAAQAIIDGATSALLPFKIGPNQYTNVPAQALLQASGGGR